MKVGDKIKFEFGKKKEKKVGVVFKLFPNTVYLKVDFEKSKGKIVKRKLNELVQGKAAEKAEKKSGKKA